MLDPTATSKAFAGEGEPVCPDVEGLRPNALVGTTPVGPLQFDHAWLETIHGFNTGVSVIFAGAGPRRFEMRPQASFALYVYEEQPLVTGKNYTVSLRLELENNYIELPAQVILSEAWEPSRFTPTRLAGEIRVKLDDANLSGSFDFDTTCLTRSTD